MPSASGDSEALLLMVWKQHSFAAAGMISEGSQLGNKRQQHPIERRENTENAKSKEELYQKILLYRTSPISHEAWTSNFPRRARAV